jgi:peptidoglycan/LPS O-acetylase OafA/YrhL
MAALAAVWAVFALLHVAISARNLASNFADRAEIWMVLMPLHIVIGLYLLNPCLALLRTKHRVVRTLVVIVCLIGLTEPIAALWHRPQLQALEFNILFSMTALAVLPISLGIIARRCASAIRGVIKPAQQS